MTPLASVDCSDKEKRTRRLTLTGPARALLISLCCVLVQCGGGSNDSNSSQATGGANTSSGGAMSTGGNASGGGNGGAQSAVSGGASVVNSSSGSGGMQQSTSSSSVGTTPAGGTSGTKTSTSSASGGATTSGASGSTGLGGAALAGGAAGATTKPATGGKSSTGGTTTVTGGANGTGGKSNPGGAANIGGAGNVGGKSSTGGAGGATVGTFMVTSPGWTNMEGCDPDAPKTTCAALPTDMTRSGAGTSPELHWTGAPEGTKSFVVLLQDLNNLSAHWILWNIPSTVTTLAANVDRTTATPATPAGSQQCGKGTDAATDDGYYGPGAPCNAYELVVYALSIATFSPTTPKDPEAVRTQLKALGSSILGTTYIRGRTNQCS